MRSDDKPLRPEVLAAISNLPEVQGAVREAAKDIRKRAAALAPKKSGTLRRGLAFERVVGADFGIYYIVGWTRKAFYGSQVELGHEGADPQPHLIPALVATGLPYRDVERGEG